MGGTLPNLAHQGIHVDAHPGIWPPDLFEATGLGSSLDSADDDEDREWWLIYAKSRQEKAIARNLHAQRIPYFLPLIKRRSVSRGRVRVAHVPLFAGYVFLHGSNDERILSMKTNRVSTTQLVPDGSALRSDLKRIADLIALDAPLSPESRLEPGQTVRIKSGRFAGLEGTILKRRGKTRLLVTVDFLQQGASVELDDFMLELG